VPNPIITVEEATGGVLEELEDAFFDIPFENSDFQNRVFVVAAQQTPARAYRAVGLRMFAKIRAVKEYKFAQEKLAIDIEEREAKIADPETDRFECRRLILENVKAADDRKWGEKLLNDALRELNCLYVEFKKLPKYRREEFEAEEQVHFMARMERQLKAPGPHESIANMLVDVPEWDKRIEQAITAMLEFKE
jgi:hypothetical protein